MLQYLLDYPLGKKLQTHLEFYISQLNYEMEMGRESTLEMMATFFSSFPQVTDYCNFGNFWENFIFVNSVKRHICDIKNLRLWHDLPISINDRMIWQICEGFIFHETSHVLRK